MLEYMIHCIWLPARYDSILTLDMTPQLYIIHYVPWTQKTELNCVHLTLHPTLQIMTQIWDPYEYDTYDSEKNENGVWH